MRNSLVFTALAFLALNASAKTSVKSVYTDIKADCVVVSDSTDLAEIDFHESHCKAFGGYELKIEGGDLRYSPSLSFQGEQIQMHQLGEFHDLGSSKIEWMYELNQDEAGSGELAWKGLIYRLAVDGDDGQSTKSRLFAVRLEGKASCLIGEAKDNNHARELVLKAKSGCK